MQRELLNATASICTIIEKNKKAIELIRWAVTSANQLGSHRDDTIHAPYAIFIGGSGIEVVPSTFLANPKAESLKDKELLKEFSRHTSNAKMLASFAMQISGYLRACQTSAPSPLPEKPSLQKEPHRKE